MRANVTLLVVGMAFCLSLCAVTPSPVQAETGAKDNTPRERWARMLWANITNAVVNSSFPFMFVGSSSNTTVCRAVDALMGTVLYTQTLNASYLELPEQVMVWLNGTAEKKQVFYEYNTEYYGSGLWLDTLTASAAYALGGMANYAFLVPKWRPLLQEATSVFISRFVNLSSYIVFGSVAYNDTIVTSTASSHNTANVIQSLAFTAMVLDNSTVRDVAYSLCVNYPLGAIGLPYYSVNQDGTALTTYCKEDESFGLFTLALCAYYNYFPNATIATLIDSIADAFYRYGWNTLGDTWWNYQTDADTGDPVSSIAVHGFGCADEAFVQAYLVTGNATFLGRAKLDMVTLINHAGMMENGLITHSTSVTQHDADESWNVYARRTFNIMYNLNVSGFYRNATLLGYANEQLVNSTVGHQRALGIQLKVVATDFTDYTPVNLKLHVNKWLQYVNRTNVAINSLSDLYEHFGMLNYGNVATGAVDYTFLGAYWEDSGDLTYQAVTVTVYYENLECAPFSLNGTYTFRSPCTPLYFRFGFPSPREYWVTSGEEGGATIRVYNGTLTSYTVAFLDTTNVLDASPYVRFTRLVDGVWRTVEKRKVDAENKVVVSLESGERYTLTIMGDTSYTFGELLMYTSTSITLTLKGVDFPKDTLLTSKYTRIYVSRSFGTPTGNITVTYEDTLGLTTSVLVCFNYKNGTNAYNTTETTSSFVVTWGSAVNATDYQITLTIVHQSLGTWTWRQYSGGVNTVGGFDISFLGGADLPIDTSVMIPMLLILFAGGCFTVINSEVGALFMVLMAAIMVVVFGLPISGSAMIVAASLAVLGLIIAAKRKV